MRKLYDVDGVLADLVGGLCAIVGDYGPEHVTAYEFEHCMPSLVTKTWRLAMLNPGFALSLPAYPDARAMIEKDLAEGFDVVYVTKPYRPSRTWAFDRLEWLDKYMPKAPIVQTGHKYLIQGDMLIEDSADNLAHWLSHHPNGSGILIDRPWNQDIAQLEYMRPDKWVRVIC